MKTTKLIEFIGRPGFDLQATIRLRAFIDCEDRREHTIWMQTSNLAMVYVRKLFLLKYNAF